MEKNKRLLVAILLNTFIATCEIGAIFVDIFVEHAGKYNILERIIYYTIDSNMFCLVSCVLFVIFGVLCLKNQTIMPKFVSILRFFASCCVFITFFVVITILIPMGLDPVEALFGNHLLFYHTLCPILSVLSFLLFEKDERITKKDAFLSCLPTMGYGVVFIILNIFQVVAGPYPFLLVYNQPIWASILWVVGFLIYTILLGLLFRKLNQIGLKNNKSSIKSLT